MRQGQERPSKELKFPLKQEKARHRSEGDVGRALQAGDGQCKGREVGIHMFE